MTQAATPRRKARKSVKDRSERPLNHQTEAALPPSEQAAGPESKPVRPTYTFRPVSGGEPIVFPAISTVEIDAKFLWEIYNLNELYQSFEWMNRAGVDRSVQERVMDLSPVEREQFWKGWFQSATSPVVEPKGSAPPGES